MAKEQKTREVIVKSECKFFLCTLHTMNVSDLFTCSSDTPVEEDKVKSKKGKKDR